MNDTTMLQGSPVNSWQSWCVSESPAAPAIGAPCLLDVARLMGRNAHVFMAYKDIITCFLGWLVCLPVLGLHSCADFFLVAASRGYSSLPCTGFLTAVASFVVEHGLQGTWTQQLWLSCSVACGVFPDQGQNPGLLRWQVDSLPLSHQGSPKYFIF